MKVLLLLENVAKLYNLNFNLNSTVTLFSRQKYCRVVNLSKAQMPRTFIQIFSTTMDQITIKTSNPKCRIYWYLIEFIAWRYSQSVTLVFLTGAGIFKPLWRPGIDAKASIPPAYVAWRAGTITLFLLGA